jgi:hypothetical protein
LEGEKQRKAELYLRGLEKIEMNFEIYTDPATGEIRFNGIITRRAMMELQLDRIDRQVMDSKSNSASDQLQSLEILFRRYEQQEREKQRKAHSK